ncbi:hypothetical protein BRAS3809_2590011 [Bradyrhizobium sp. STM 3809]|nr:hypothetical protein BRAS3809_2590011 [Bradyrhizobium sp. STM 3809]
MLCGLAGVLADQGGEAIEQGDGERAPFHHQRRVHRVRPRGIGGIAQNQHAAVDEQAAIAVFGEAGQTVNVVDHEASALQRFDQRIAQPLRQLVQRDEAGGGICGDQGGMPPAVAERDALQGQPRWPDRAELQQHLLQDVGGRETATGRRSGELIEQAAGTRAILGSEHLRLCRRDLAEPAQQRYAAVQPDQGIVSAHLKAAFEIGDGELSQLRRIGAQWIAGVGGERAAGKHVEARQRQPLGAADARTGHGVLIAPSRTGAGIEQHAGDRKVELGPRSRGCIRPGRLRRDRSPAVDAADHEVPPARVERHLAARIRRVGHVAHEIGDGIELGEIDAEMRQPAVEAERKQLMRPLAHGAGGQEIGDIRHDRPLRSVLLERAADGVAKLLRLLRLQREIAGGLLRRDLDMGVGRDQLVGDRHALDDVDALADQRIVFHVAHRDEAVDPLDAEPVDDIRHQLLETRILHAGDAFGALEVSGRGVAVLLALARIVDEELGDLAERAAFLAVVDDDAEAAVLARGNAFLDAVDQIGAAGADVRAEHVGAVALVMHATCDLGPGIIQLGDVAEQIDRGAADRRQEDLQVRPRHQLRIHAAGLLEQATTQIGLAGAEARGDTRQVPHRVDRDLDHRHAAIGMHDVAVMDEALRGERGMQLRQLDARLGHRDGRPDVDAFGDLAAEIFRDQVAPGIERDDLGWIAPLVERADGGGGMGVGEVRAADRIERAGGDRERAVDRVGAAMAADDVAILRPRHRADHRAALARACRAPVEREVMLGAWHRVRGQADVIRAVGASHRTATPKTATARLDDGPEQNEFTFSMHQYSSFSAANKGVPGGIYL